MCGLGASRCWTWGKKKARSANGVKLLFPAAVNNEQTRLPGLGFAADFGGSQDILVAKAFVLRKEEAKGHRSCLRSEKNKPGKPGNVRKQNLTSCGLRVV